MSRICVNCAYGGVIHYTNLTDDANIVGTLESNIRLEISKIRGVLTEKFHAGLDTVLNDALDRIRNITTFEGLTAREEYCTQLDALLVESVKALIDNGGVIGRSDYALY